MDSIKQYRFNPEKGRIEWKWEADHEFQWRKSLANSEDFVDIESLSTALQQYQEWKKSLPLVGQIGMPKVLWMCRDSQDSFFITSMKPWYDFSEKRWKNRGYGNNTENEFLTIVGFLKVSASLVEHVLGTDGSSPAESLVEIEVERGEDENG